MSINRQAPNNDARERTATKPSVEEAAIKTTAPIIAKQKAADSAKYRIARTRGKKFITKKARTIPAAISNTSMTHSVVLALNIP